ncbi:hypothetical protein HHO41_03435 [Bacillus sp. DNRA2]|uniref:hypothetical protein n=1 Tax=Bacillus sp. DNRA2 TaxID=2723053 RepID=UPI00145F0200|nr:hypothetical protein [Bacillus sp. DNRA2]NMD69327.1 hypothetical protein [Bacillus sp. DNRA2]
MKKPFYKKWWVWVLAIIIIGFIGSLGDDDSDKTSTTTKEETKTDTTKTETTKEVEKTEPTEPAKQEEPKKAEGKIKSGVYKVGTDLTAGEYLVFAKSIAYIEAASDSTGKLESIIFNDNLPSGSHSYVTLNDGDYFKLQGAEMYPVASAPSVIPKNGLYKEGMYKVGPDIPAGEYKVTLGSSGMGYIEVNTGSRHQLDGIVTNENVQADMYITVADGQYLTLRGVSIQK